MPRPQNQRWHHHYLRRLGLRFQRRRIVALYIAFDDPVAVAVDSKGAV